MSDLIAQQIRTFRKLRNLTLAQLATECERLGAPQLSLSALANIERGQTAESKRRRRDVSADELMVFAKAFGVPPLCLLFPLGANSEVELLPGESVDSWEAARWFTGEAPMPGDDDPRWDEGAAPLALRREHARCLHEIERAPGAARNLSDSEEDAHRIAHRMRALAIADLFRIRAEMRRHGVTPPPLPDEVAALVTPDWPEWWTRERMAEQNRAVNRAEFGDAAATGGGGQSS